VGWFDPVEVIVSTAAGAMGGATMAGTARLVNSVWRRAVCESGDARPVAALPRTGSALRADRSKNLPLPGGGSREFAQAPLAHGFPDVVDNYAGTGSKFILPDGAVLYQVSGSLAGVAGRFEWIVEKGAVTHRMFVENGSINGDPIKP
jgi:filamentous hemagglutinin